MFGLGNFANAAIEFAFQYKELLSWLVFFTLAGTYLFRRSMKRYAVVFQQIAEAAGGSTALYQATLDAYTEVPIGEPKESVTLTRVDGTQKECFKLKDAKQIAKMRLLAELAKNQETAQWDAASSHASATPENKTAYLTALALQQIGLACFAGIVPLKLALANVQDVFIDDWMICRGWLRGYRESEGYEKTDSWDKSQTVDFHRRHAEWAFCLAVLHSRKVAMLYLSNPFR